MKKILFGLSIVLLYSNIVYAEGIGTLRDNTKVEISIFNEYKTEMGVSTGDVRGLIETEITDRENADTNIWNSTPTYGLSRADIADSTFTHLQANQIKLGDGTVLTSTIVPEGFTSSSTARIPTIYICASNSPAELQAIANFVCDGTNDDIEWNMALSSINYFGGGKIIAENGTYNITSTLYVSSNTTITGQGWGTYLNCINNNNQININNNAKNIYIKDLEIRIQSSAGGVYIFFAGENSNITVDHCYLANMALTVGEAIYFANNTYSNIYIKNNLIEQYAKLHSIYYTGTGTTTLNNYYITDNIFKSLGDIGNYSKIDLSRTTNAVIKGNLIDDCKNGINIASSCNNIHVINNIVNSCSNIGYNILGSSCVISGNSVYNAGSANAVIANNTNKSDINSWDIDNLKTDGSVAMTAGLPLSDGTILSSTGSYADNAEFQAVKNSTSALVDVANSTFTHAQINQILLGDGTVLTSTTGFGAGASGLTKSQIEQTTFTILNATEIYQNGVPVSTDGVSQADFDAYKTNVKTDTDTLNNLIAWTTGQFNMQFSTWAETGDIAELYSRSTFTIIDVRFYASSAPITAMTFSCKKIENGTNLMNGSMSLNANTNFSNVVLSTSSVPMDSGMTITVVSGRCNGIVHTTFRYRKQIGQ
jgi:hypothetical protein